MKFYLSILLCLVCLSCANQADQYIIRGSFPGLQDGMTVRLLNAETRNKDEQLLAADTVKNGRFELTGSVDAPACSSTIPLSKSAPHISTAYTISASTAPTTGNC